MSGRGQAAGVSVHCLSAPGNGRKGFKAQRRQVLSLRPSAARCPAPVHPPCKGKVKGNALGRHAGQAGRNSLQAWLQVRVGMPGSSIHHRSFPVLPSNGAMAIPACRQAVPPGRWGNLSSQSRSESVCSPACPVRWVGWCSSSISTMG